MTQRGNRSFLKRTLDSRRKFSVFLPQSIRWRRSCSQSAKPYMPIVVRASKIRPSFWEGRRLDTRVPRWQPTLLSPYLLVCDQQVCLCSFCGRRCHVFVCNGSLREGTVARMLVLRVRQGGGKGESWGKTLTVFPHGPPFPSGYCSRQAEPAFAIPSSFASPSMNVPSE